MVDIMGNEVLEVINWYEEQFERKLTQAEKASIRVQALTNKAHAHEIKDLEKIDICLGGLKYKKIRGRQ